MLHPIASLSETCNSLIKCHCDSYVDTVVLMVWIGSTAGCGVGGGPGAFAGGFGRRRWTRGRGSGQAGCALTPVPVPAYVSNPWPPTASLEAGSGRRAWKKSLVSLARRAWFVNKHWGGRRRPRSRWFRSCPPARAVPPSGCHANAPGRRRRPVLEVQGTPSHLEPGPVGCSLFISCSSVRSLIHKDLQYNTQGPSWSLLTLKGDGSKQVLAVQRGRPRVEFTDTVLWETENSNLPFKEDPGRLPGGGAVRLRMWTAVRQRWERIGKNCARWR